MSLSGAIVHYQPQLTRKDFEKIHTHADWRYKAEGCAASACRNQFGKARLGLIAGKKPLPLAVSRNRFKRIAREVFRAYQQKLRGLDVIIVARVPARDLRARELKVSLEQLLSRLTACASSS